MPSHRTSRLFPILTLAAVVLLSPLGAVAAGLDAGESYEAPTIEPELEQSVRLCTEKVDRVVRDVSNDNYRWMTESRHEIYRVEKQGVTLASIEVLSTPRLDSCQASRGVERETSIVLKYYLPNGVESSESYHFEDDEIFFDGAPKVFADVGQVQLRGVDREGVARSRFVALERLQDIVIAHGLDPQPTGERIAMNTATRR